VWYVTRETPAPYIGPHTIRTPNLGISFEQHDKIVPLTRVEGDIFSAKLERAPFSIQVPNTYWSSTEADYPWLQITISDSPKLFKLASFENNMSSIDDGTLGMGVADFRHGGGSLVTAGDLSWPGPLRKANIISRERFNLSKAGSRGLYVSAILDAEDDFNYITDGQSVYMVLYIDYVDTNPGKIMASEVDRLMIDFVN
jgi:hypothetical protein